MGPALAQHDRLLRASVDAHGGSVIKTTGDGMLAVFADAVAADRRGGRGPASPARCDLGRDRPVAGPDGAPCGCRRGARRGLLRSRPQSGGADPRHRPRRPDHLLGGRRRARPRWAPGVGRARRPRLAPASRHRPTRADLPGRRRRPRPRLPAAPLAEHAPIQPAGPADELRRTGEGARRGGDAHRAPPAGDAHRHGRDRQDPSDAGGGRPAHRPLRGRRVDRGAGSARRPVADPVRGRPRARRARGARASRRWRPSPRSSPTRTCCSCSTTPSTSSTASHGSPNDCSRARRACTS